MAAQDRERGDFADGGVHRTRRRFGPRLAPDPRASDKRSLGDRRGEKLANTRGTIRPAELTRAPATASEGLRRDFASAHHPAPRDLTRTLPHPEDARDQK